MVKPYKKDEVVKGVIDFIKDTTHETEFNEVVLRLGSFAKSLKEAKVAHIYTVLPLDETIKNQIRKKIESMVGHEVTIRETVDKNLLGGVKIRVGDWVYDGTISGQLVTLKNQLYENV